MTWNCNWHFMLSITENWAPDTPSGWNRHMTVRGLLLSGFGRGFGMKSSNYVRSFRLSWIFFPPFIPPSNQITKGEIINKETGELTASGELSISELKAAKEESSCKSRQLPQELRDQLKELGIHARSSPKHTSNHVPSEQREELLDKVLPLYIQVS